MRSPGASRAKRRGVSRVGRPWVALGALVLASCGESEHSTNDSRNGVHAGAAGYGASDAGQATSGASGTGAAPANGSGGGGPAAGGAATAGTSDSAGTTASGTGGTGVTGLSGSGGTPTTTGGSGDMAGSDAGSAGQPGGEIEPSEWSEWSVTPMPNAPGSDLPHEQKYTRGTDSAHDDVTGLTWQRRINTDITDPALAAPYCEGLELDGKRGFRVPRVIELVTLIDYLRGSHAIDGSVFDVGDSEVVISSTKTSYSTVPNYWMVDFTNGKPTDRADPTGTLCVSGGPSGALPEHYTLGADTVLDNWTGLTWAPSSASADARDYDDAVAYCAGLTLDAATFRLPSLNELMTVWDFSEIPAVLSTAFFDYDEYGPGFWVAPTPRMAPAGAHLSISERVQVLTSDSVPMAKVICVH